MNIKLWLKLALTLMILTAFTGLATAQLAQVERKAGPPIEPAQSPGVGSKAGGGLPFPVPPSPQANEVTLIKVGISRGQGCVVTALVEFAPPTSAKPIPLAGYTVKFDKVSKKGGQPPYPSAVTNSKGETPSITVPYDTTIQATVHSQMLLRSNTFVCGP